MDDSLWARFVDSSKQELSPPKEIQSKLLTIDTFQWQTPSVQSSGDTIMQISLNKQDWHDVRDPNSDSSFGYYQSPHVTSISPSFGHVKATKDVTIDVSGSGFACLDEACSDLQCRFGNSPSQYIFVKGVLANSELIRCKVPEYTKPDVLGVEVTINGESYTSDNKTYGFFDPFVLDAVPRLISTDGSTQIEIKGLGFVNSGQSKASLNNRTHSLLCGDGPCTKPAVFKDKNTLITSTFA